MLIVVREAYVLPRLATSPPAERRSACWTDRRYPPCRAEFRVWTVLAEVIPDSGPWSGVRRCCTNPAARIEFQILAQRQILVGGIRC